MDTTYQQLIDTEAVWAELEADPEFHAFVEAERERTLEEMMARDPDELEAEMTTN